MRRLVDTRSRFPRSHPRLLHLWRPGGTACRQLPRRLGEWPRRQPRRPHCPIDGTLRHFARPARRALHGSADGPRSAALGPCRPGAAPGASRSRTDSVIGWSEGGQYALAASFELAGRVTGCAVIAGCPPLDDAATFKRVESSRSHARHPCQEGTDCSTRDGDLHALGVEIRPPGTPGGRDTGTTS